jgi:hypothetical protein
VGSHHHARNLARKTKGFSCAGTAPAIAALKEQAEAAGAMQARDITYYILYNIIYDIIYYII